MNNKRKWLPNLITVKIDGKLLEELNYVIIKLLTNETFIRTRGNINEI
ncbi:hypothetical protein RI065_02485 [Mycoplasmatota bacterium zrk1]